MSCSQLKVCALKIYFTDVTLKVLKKIHLCWPFNCHFNVKVWDQSQIKKIFHGPDLEELLDIDKIDDYLNIKPKI